MIVYLNGEFVDSEAATVSVFDHGFLYGDGVYEGIKACDGRVFALEEHATRFLESARSLDLDIGLDHAEFVEAVLETVRRNGLRDAYIRPVASRGKGSLGLDPRNCGAPTVVIIVDSQTAHPEADGSARQGIRVITSAMRRSRPDMLSPRIKSTNYLNNILAKQQATAAGMDDAILLNDEGFVAELTGCNLFLVKDKRLITPPVHAGILAGVTRQTILDLARGAGIEVAEEPVTLHDLYTADECFGTATRIEIVPIGWIDGRRIGDGASGPLTQRLARLFTDHISRNGTPIYPNDKQTEAQS